MMSNIDEMTNTMLQNIENKTGKNLEEWIEIANNSPATKHKEIIDYLITEYGLTYGYANLIALKTREAEGGQSTTGEALIDAQYTGNKSDLLRFTMQSSLRSIILGGISKLPLKRAMSASAGANSLLSYNLRQKPGSM